MENANANNFPELERDLQHLAVVESELADQAEDVVGDRDGAAVAADEEVDVRTDEEDIEEEAEFNGQIEDINGQIEDLRRREQELEKVLEDVLTDVTSPEVSDEDEEIVEPMEQVNGEAAVLFQQLKMVQVVPTEGTSYFDLYEQPAYKRRAIRKIKKMKRVLHEVRFNVRLLRTTAITSPKDLS